MIKFQIGQISILLVPHKNVVKEILLINPRVNRKTIWIFIVIPYTSTDNLLMKMDNYQKFHLLHFQ